MRCSNPDCNRGIGLVAYRRGWSSKRYCTQLCRDAFVADAPNLQQNQKNPFLKRFVVAFVARFVVAFVAFVGLITMAVLAAPPGRGRERQRCGDADTNQKPQRRGQFRNMHGDAALFFRSGKGTRGDRTVQKRYRTRTRSRPLRRRCRAR